MSTPVAECPILATWQAVLQLMEMAESKTSAHVRSSWWCSLFQPTIVLNRPLELLFVFIIINYYYYYYVVLFFYDITDWHRLAMFVVVKWGLMSMIRFHLRVNCAREMCSRWEHRPARCFCCWLQELLAGNLCISLWENEIGTSSLTRRMMRNIHNYHPYAQCMVYLPTKLAVFGQMLVNIPYMEHMGQLLDPELRVSCNKQRLKVYPLIICYIAMV